MQNNLYKNGVMSSSAPQVQALAQLFSTLASPVRLAIILQLADGAKCVHELVDTLQHSQPLISQHLRVLREARLVTAGQRGREVVYRLTDEHVVHIVRDGHHHILEEEPHDHDL